MGPLKSTNEEADKRLTLHAVHSQFYTVVVSSRDTDVLLIFVSHFQSMQYQQLWMKLGTSKKWRYVPIDAVFKKVTKASAASLLAFHALTGCDTTSYIAKHIKRSSRKILKEHHGLLKNLGICDLTEETIKCSETIVCRLLCVQNRRYRCSTDLIVVQDRETSSSNGPNKRCTPFSLDESTLSSDDVVKCPLPHT